MLDNFFTSSPSIWAGLIAGAILLPVLIHLINLVRYKKVPFAAMEFLLKSKKNSKNYVWLKQLLLLLARVAALLLALFLMSQAGCQEDRIARILGGRSTHHYVLLDDSFSMTDTQINDAANALSPVSAFDHARNVLVAIAGRVSNRRNQKFSLVRFSAGETVDENGRPLAIRFDLENRLVDSTFGALLDDARGAIEPSALAAGPAGIVEKIAGLVEERQDENSIVYILSDFRRKDWEAIGELEPELQKIKQSGGAVELVNCAPPSQNNVAVIDLAPVSNVRVASTPLMMEVRIKNYATTPVRKLRVLVSTETFSQSPTPTGLVKKTEDLPAIFIEKIGPKETVSRRFPVFFQSPGQHAVSVRCPDDAVLMDNQRVSRVTINEQARVLIVDDANLKHATYVGLALNPNELTGIAPEIQPKAFLRDTDSETLSQFDVIFLLDVDGLDETAVGNLREFCRSGGGLAYFLGPKANLSFYNQLYDSGRGIFPVELDQVVDVKEDTQRAAADFTPLDHPVFVPVLNQKTSLLDLVELEKVIAPTRQWRLSKPDTAQVIATVRGDDRRPLMVESSFGRGRIVACLTSAGPVWNNWARNATYLPILLLLEDYLAGGKMRTDSFNLSMSVKLIKSSNEFLSNVSVFSPVARSDQRDEKELEMIEVEGGELVVTLPTYTSAGREAMNYPGIYDFWFQRLNGAWDINRTAINVDVNESDLEVVTPGKLLTRLQSVEPTWVDWNQFNPEPDVKRASSLSRLLLLLILLVFAVEPLLAYLSSFHHA